MFNLLKITAQFILGPFRVTDKASCRAFLRGLFMRVKSHAKATNTPIDDTLLQHIEFILSHNALFDYVHDLISNQLQTEAVQCESADANTIVTLIGDAPQGNSPSPEAINPALIVSLITRIVSVINTIKTR